MVKRFKKIYMLLLMMPTFCVATIYDNRYFPWFSRLYTGTTSAHATSRFEGFVVKANEAFKVEVRANKEDQVTSFFGFEGEFNLYNVAKSLEETGHVNPLQTVGPVAGVNWFNVTDNKVDSTGTFQGQGLRFSGYMPVHDHIGVGLSVGLLRFVSDLSFVPHKDTQLYINKETHKNWQSEYHTKILKPVMEAAGITGNLDRQSGFTDVDMYVKLFDVQEYCLKCRQIDYSLSLGLLLPLAEAKNINNIASVPFGGNKHWGWYIAPHVEAELKEDLKAGVMGRLTQRFEKTYTMRMPYNKEISAFGVLQGDMRVVPGTTFTLAPYVVFEDLRDGVGAKLRYTITKHMSDTLYDQRADKTYVANLTTMFEKSTWTQEYGSIELFYNLKYKLKHLPYDPIISLQWDVPLNFITGVGFSKTHRVSLGLSCNF